MRRAQETNELMTTPVLKRKYLPRVFKQFCFEISELPWWLQIRVCVCFVARVKSSGTANATYKHCTHCHEVFTKTVQLGILSTCNKFSTKTKKNRPI